MKLLNGKIKRWSFKQRLFEIQKRLKALDERLIRNHDLADTDLDEALQILNYWMENMAGVVEKSETPKENKPKKPVNLW